MNASQPNFLELSQELLNYGSLLRFRARGMSMYPFIKNGSIITIQPQEANSVKPGDVIFYRSADGVLTAHRLVKIFAHNSSLNLVTKGDSLKYLDPAIPANNVLGKVIRIEDNKKQLILTNWTGKVFGFLLSWSVRGCYPNQIRVVRNLGRLWWLTGGRNIR